MYKYLNSDENIKVGDVFTDGSSGSEDVRLQNKAKVLYVDKFILVWFPLNEFTQTQLTTNRRTHQELGVFLVNL